MSQRRGFTIVELVIVMVIMAILLGLSALGFSTVQANARDAERKTDVENLARGLETRYREGNHVITDVTGVDPSFTLSDLTGPGSYPSVLEWRHLTGQTVAQFSPDSVSGGYGPDDLPGTELSSFISPNNSGDYSGVDTICDTDTSCEVESTTQILAKIPNARNGKYIYEPLDANGELCYYKSPCTRFNLYWRPERLYGGSTQTIRSKHQ